MLLATSKSKVVFRNWVNSTDDISPEAMAILTNCDWPGNIRELRNAIESMLVLEGGKRLNGDDVRKYLREQPSAITDRNLPVISNKTVEQAERELIYRALVDLKSNIIEMKELLTGRIISSADESQGNHTQPHNGVLTMGEMERRMISSSLDRNKGNRRLAAKELNISERTLYRKIKDFGLQ